MAVLIFIRTLIVRIWSTLTGGNRRMHESGQLAQYHPWMFGRVKGRVEIEHRPLNHKL